MLQIRKMPSTVSLIDAENFIADAVLHNGHGSMLIRPASSPLLVLGSDHIELHTSFGTIHHLHYADEAMMKDDWNALLGFMKANIPNNGYTSWLYRDEETEYLLTLSVSTLLRVANGTTDGRGMKRTVVIDSIDYSLHVELDVHQSQMLTGELTNAMCHYWA